MSDTLIRELREGGPLSPAVQFRRLLEYGRDHGWEFDTAWRWSYERVRWPHDTTHRKEWKKILGESCDDPRRTPAQQREAWRSAYERGEQTHREQSIGTLVAV